MKKEREIGNVFGILVFGVYVAVAIWTRNNRRGTSMLQDRSQDRVD